MARGVGTGGGPGLVVFDCDGVLVDSEPLVADIEARLLAEWSVPVGAEEILERFTGRPEAEVLAELEAEHGVPLGPEFAARKAALLEEAFAARLQPVAGMPELLRTLPWRRCVASSSRPERIALSLAVTGLAGYFSERHFSATEVAHGKPAPDLFLLAADAMGVSPADCVVVEDSVAGITAGVAAGMDVIGFTAAGHLGPGAPERLADAGAGRLAASSAELGALLQDG